MTEQWKNVQKHPIAAATTPANATIGTIAHSLSTVASPKMMTNRPILSRLRQNNQ